jgi:hypothetical protein
VNQTVEGFIGTYLHVEVAYSGMEQRIRETIPTFGLEYANSLKEGFEELLATRELSVGDYDGLTHVEFASDDELYAYLQSMYAFLFNAAAAPAPSQ